jgi:hypothetical protein
MATSPLRQSGEAQSRGVTLPIQRASSEWGMSMNYRGTPNDPQARLFPYINLSRVAERRRPLQVVQILVLGPHH